MFCFGYGRGLEDKYFVLLARELIKEYFQLCACGVYFVAVMSSVWEHFVLDPDEKFAICEHCGARISRGVWKSTSNLIKHLRGQHSDKYSNEKQDKNKRNAPPSQQSLSKLFKSHGDITSSEAGENSNSAKEQFSASTYSSLPSTASTSGVVSRGPTKCRPKVYMSSRQQTITDSFDKQTKFPRGDKRQTDIVKLIAKMICVDGQPISVIENRGFKELVNHLEPRFSMPSRKSLANEVIPQMYNDVLNEVKDKLSIEEYVALTTDLWTSVSNDDYLSLTVHYLDQNFIWHHLCVEVVPFPEVSHTADNICSFITEVLADWQLSEKVVAILRDNGRNITAGLEQSAFVHVACIAHTLQLVLKDGLLSHKIVTNLLPQCRRLVGHFKHSARATKILKQCQTTASVPQHRLIQDEPTRWNSTLHMLKRLQEQKRAILLSSGELNLPELTGQQWTLIENLIPILDVFYSATLQVSSPSVTASEVC
ncbi:zinc finger BED domain-containing protein 4-like [Bacillus rossius redtenbacheri]|uniref:zinc finger BED domain-containing protein 4-like n=1 Tax=Bacillus rossius redtenbacheri TaxID=93214 RepID=UPI002FDEB6F6